jgi:hypothetical protein
LMPTVSAARAHASQSLHNLNMLLTNGKAMQGPLSIYLYGWKEECNGDMAGKHIPADQLCRT